MQEHTLAPVGQSLIGGLLPGPSPDYTLLARMGASDALTHRVLPWQQQGAVTVVAARGNAGKATQARLRQVFGQVAICPVAPDQFDQELLPLLQQATVARAETLLPRDQSCRPIQQSFGLQMTALAVVALLALAPSAVFAALCLVAAVLCIANALLKFTCAVAAGRTPPPATALADDALPVFTLFVPLLFEEDIASHLLTRMSALDYPRHKLDLCLLTEDHDATTRAALARTTLPPWVRVIEVPAGTIRTKPRAMNYALPLARGSIIGIYDAEDNPAPDHLRRVAAEFAARPANVVCLQGKLDYFNASANFLTRCFTLEYAVWFRLFLPGLGRMGMVVPLGGTTLFLRDTAIRALHGWDAHNVTEDADLGIRIARAGYRTQIIDITTQEEANGRLWPWVKQRSRWLKGFAMTWAAQMRDPAALLRDIGPIRFGVLQIMLIGMLVQTLLAPLLWSMWLIVLGLPHPLTRFVAPDLLRATAIAFFAAEAVQLVTYTIGAKRAGKCGLIPWSPLMHLYFPLATAALIKALWEMVKRPHYWDKTRHGFYAPPRA
ncbi:processive 1,2-diacylglycerol beta-glucosyltransferase [Ketogulonicigenium robustum]|uniref:Processive 1,2-diacylglycerol beta-glucosyltransferase n=1 Tax=Ketogulonicigenium robustum TaxID=92947 RepID=A0A1W6NY80_9RHOB|nr:glycosyltransferase family 2 protein [Ketogulonicigenium robustum]ARO14131.1 processive 1,2-diacylglycerol beta-glucosyltransferase [Ketogulonicigenium robustum]